VKFKHAVIASTYTPGPNGETQARGTNRDSVGGVMDPRQRLTTAMAYAAPTQQLTPNQLWFRSSMAQGRWPTDFDAGAAAPANLIRQDSDGVTDVSSLEPVYNPNGADQYVDLGGKGGIDVGVGKP
jgi:hypothetical protein